LGAHTIGELVIGGLDNGRFTPKTEAALAEGRLGGLILFRRDMPSLVETAEMLAHARRLSPRPILVGIDEEGGIASQIDGLPVGAGSLARAASVPSPAALGEIDDTKLTEELFASVARVLRLAGVDMVFAPLLDVNTESTNPVIGSRSFGATPEVVRRQGAAAIRGLRCGGVLPCVKHFPGHGASSLDSHLALPTIDEPRASFEAVHLAPFASVFHDDVPLVMTAHVSYPMLDRSPDSTSGRPATCSPELLTELLRGALGFRGAVISDALEMVGFSAGMTLDDGVAAALEAGVDLFLGCAGAAQAEEVRLALTNARDSNEWGAKRVAESFRRRAVLDALVSERDEASGSGVGAALEEAVEDARDLMRSAHDRALSPCKPEALSSTDVACLVSDGVARAFLSHRMIEDALTRIAPRSRIISHGAKGRLDPADLPPVGSVLLVLFVRGCAPSAEDLLAIRTVEAWRTEAAGRRVVALAPADRHALRETPGDWQRLGLGGSHRSAFEAAFRALFG